LASRWFWSLCYGKLDDSGRKSNCENQTAQLRRIVYIARSSSSKRRLETETACRLVADGDWQFIRLLDRILNDERAAAAAHCKE
jgi:hypothetical protein